MKAAVEATAAAKKELADAIEYNSGQSVHLASANKRLRHTAEQAVTDLATAHAEVKKCEEAEAALTGQLSKDAEMEQLQTVRTHTHTHTHTRTHTHTLTHAERGICMHQID